MNIKTTTKTETFKPSFTIKPYVNTINKKYDMTIIIFNTNDEILIDDNKNIIINIIIDKIWITFFF